MTHNTDPDIQPVGHVLAGRPHDAATTEQTVLVGVDNNTVVVVAAPEDVDDLDVMLFTPGEALNLAALLTHAAKHAAAHAAERN